MSSDDPYFTTAWALTAALAVIFLGFLHIRRRTASARRARWAYERKLTLIAGAFSVILDHEEALVRRLRQLRYKDPYGRWVTDKWGKELIYFFTTVIEVELPAITDQERIYLFGVLTRWVDDFDFDKCAAPNLASSDGLGYERQVGAVLAQIGFDVRFTPASGDQGVDLIAERQGERIAVQCKDYASTVGNDAVQQIYAGSRLYGAVRAVVVAPNGFTVSARQLAGSLGVECLHQSELGEKFAILGKPSERLSA